MTREQLRHVIAVMNSLINCVITCGKDYMHGEPKSKHIKRAEDALGILLDSQMSALAAPEPRPFCYHDGVNVVDPEFANDCDVFPLYTHPMPVPAPEPKPVGCKHFRYSVDVHEQTGTCYDCGAEGRMRFVVDAPETQPVAWREKSRFQKYPSYEYNQHGIGEPLYTAPVPAPQREWQGLTKDEINDCAGAEIYPSTWAMAFARAIEAALKEKNHG